MPTMSFQGLQRVCFWSGFALAALLLLVSVIAVILDENSSLAVFSGLTFISGAWVAILTADVLNSGKEKVTWTDKGSRGNPYPVTEVEENLLGSFASGYKWFSLAALLCGMLYGLFSLRFLR